MDSQKNNNQIIAEKWDKIETEDKIETDFDKYLKIIELFDQAVKERLTNLQEENYELQKRVKENEERLKKYENRIFDLENIDVKIGDKIWAAKFELSNQYSLKLKNLENNLEDQFLYISKNIENYRKQLYEFIYTLCGVVIAASGGLIIVSLLQIFHR